MNEQEWMAKLREEGYQGLVTCANPANMDFGQHTHEQATVHVILEGELIMKDEKGMVTVKAGDRFDIPAGTTHTAMCGATGCTMVVGMK